VKNQAVLLPSPPEGEGLGERGTVARLLGYAKRMRSTPTPWEHELWQELRAKRFSSVKFKRQQSIGPYIVDFVALSKKIIIELDGGQHDSQREYDAKRDHFLKLNGFTVVRTWNNQWAENRLGVLEQIWLVLNAPPLRNPSPSRGEGLEP
jgi:very-short-patch-repair endonuclease